MPLIYDNALTRAHSRLRDLLPMDWCIDEFDLIKNQWDLFTIAVSFPARGRVAHLTIHHVPMHLLYDVERLAEIIQFEAEGFIVEHNDGNEYWGRDWRIYEFPDTKTIIERLKSMGDTDKTSLRIFKWFAALVAEKKQTPLEAASRLHLAVWSIDVNKRTQEDRLVMEDLDGRLPELYRSLFPDEPLFAEYCVARFKLIEQQNDRHW